MPSPILQDLAIFGAGIAAGMINVIVGSGTLITFPTLLAFGFPPVLANVSNNVGLIPGSVSGVYGYRAELSGQRNRTIRLGSASLCGGLAGAILLLVLPADAFQAIVPALIGIALVMVVAQPRLARWVAARKTRASTADAAADTADAIDTTNTTNTAAESSAGLAKVDAGGPLLWFLVFCTGIYGGYFGAAQGVLLIGLLGVALGDSLQRVNAVKNILAALVNGVAAVVFIIVSHIAWGPAALIALGSVIGGQAGAKVGRKLSPWTLRAVIVCVGIAALVKLLALGRLRRRLSEDSAPERVVILQRLSRAHPDPGQHEREVLTLAGQGIPTRRAAAACRPAWPPPRPAWAACSPNPAPGTGSSW